MASASGRTMLITGAGGFLGEHLLAQVADRDRVVALDIRASKESLAEWRECDLTDAAAVDAALNDIRPDGIIHLAGITGEDNPEASFAINVGACRNILSTIRRWDAPPRVIVVGSAAMYGITEGDHEVVAEDRQLLSDTVYGVSKIMQERWALMMSARFELPIVCVRPFNIMGPGQPTRLMPSALLTQVRDVAEGRAEKLLVGNMTTERDFTDVRDVAAAMWALMNAGDEVNGRVFNIASGCGVKIADLVDACVTLSGAVVPVEQDPARIRRADVPSIVGDNSRLCEATGWSPGIDWRQSLADMWARIMNEG